MQLVNTCGLMGTLSSRSKLEHTLDPLGDLANGLRLITLLGPQNIAVLHHVAQYWIIDSRVRIGLGKSKEKSLEINSDFPIQFKLKNNVIIAGDELTHHQKSCY